MILNISQLSQFNIKIATVVGQSYGVPQYFTTCHNLVVRSEARIAENCIKCHNFEQNRL